MRLLIVNCDPDKAKSQAVSLSSRGFVVEAVPKVAEVGQLLDATSFDAVLVCGSSDREAMSALLGQLMHSHPETSFILLTSHEIAVLQRASADGSTQEDIEQLLSVLNSTSRVESDREV